MQIKFIIFSASKCSEIKYIVKFNRRTVLDSYLIKLSNLNKSVYLTCIDCSERDENVAHSLCPIHKSLI